MGLGLLSSISVLACFPLDSVQIDALIPLHLLSSMTFLRLFSAPCLFILLYVLIQHLLKIFPMLDLVQELEHEDTIPASVVPSDGHTWSVRDPRSGTLSPTRARQERASRNFPGSCRGLRNICSYIRVLDPQVYACIRETTSIGEDMVVMGQGGEGEFLGLLTM